MANAKGNAHPQRDLVTFRPGARLRPGQRLGKLRITGDTSAPHLHFQLMGGTPVPGLERSALPGRLVFPCRAIPVADFEKAVRVEGDWRRGMMESPQFKKNACPLNLNVVNFLSLARPREVDR